ncbi:MAG: hypothetical protein BM555_04680 [Crocinitomix sp. MedPE-SWsnd]|nr:MAG: hypothetical protein BM555_04680 [Crocinitomix sp. MedPE-SWsnd]
MKKVAFCFDLDGTVTSQEILPLISKEIGLHEEINLLTQITLKGLIPFQTSFKLRVKLLSQISITRVKNIVSGVALQQSIKEFIQNNSDDCYIVTGNLDVWVGDLITNELGCKYFSSEAEYEGDKLIDLKHILEKRSAISSLRDEYETIVTIGDSMNDCSMFELGDIGIAYGGVHEPVESLKKMSDYVVYDEQALSVLLNNLLP